MHIVHISTSIFTSVTSIAVADRYLLNLVKSINTIDGAAASIILIGSENEIIEIEGVLIKILKNVSPIPGVLNGFSSKLWNELHGCDLVHIHRSFSMFGAYSISVSRSLNIPVIATDIEGNENELMLNHHGIEAADGVISMTAFSEEAVIPYYSGKRMIIDFPIDTGKFTINSIIPRDFNSVVCVCGIYPWYGLERVITALPITMRLVMIGKIYDQAHYQFLQKLAVGKNVNFETNVNEPTMINYFQSSGIYIQLFSRFDKKKYFVPGNELSEYAPMMAMACGLPVIISEGELHSGLESNSQQLFRFDTEGELSSILTECLEKNWQSKEFSESARSLIIENFGLEKVGQRIMDFYDEVRHFRDDTK